MGIHGGSGHVVTPELCSVLEEAIARAANEPSFRIERQTPVSGGCINEALCVEGRGRRYFVKLGRLPDGRSRHPDGMNGLAVFEAEAQGLETIAATGNVRVPRPIVWGDRGGRPWLVMEYIPMTASAGGERLGERLAALHRNTADRFGWRRNNNIDATPQPNDWSADWIDFLRERRIGFQLQLARQDGAGHSLLDKGEPLLAGLPALFGSYRPRPSLIHGDLWGGNQAVDQDGEPILFDPAVHYADREADLAMTELFGGFDRDFYAAYHAAWPLDPGYAVRKTLYQLYHILNHHHLFGGGYALQAEPMMDRLLAEI